MAGQYMTPEAWAFIVVCAVVAVLGFVGVVTAVCRRGGRR
jgi:hypothetical protein